MRAEIYLDKANTRIGVKASLSLLLHSLNTYIARKVGRNG